MSKVKLRDLRSALRSSGCVVDHVSGSHEIWRLPCGKRLPPVVLNPKNTVTFNVLKTIERVLRSEGIQLQYG